MSQTAVESVLGNVHHKGIPLIELAHHYADSVLVSLGKTAPSPLQKETERAVKRLLSPPKPSSRRRTLGGSPEIMITARPSRLRSALTTTVKNSKYTTAHVLSLFSVYVLFLVAVKLHEVGSEIVNPGVGKCLARQSTTFGFLISTIANAMGSSCTTTIDRQNKMNLALLTFMLTITAGSGKLSNGNFVVSVKTVYGNVYKAYFTIFNVYFSRAFGEEPIAIVDAKSATNAKKKPASESDGEGESESDGDDN
jgi:hypothetical protein